MASNVWKTQYESKYLIIDQCISGIVYTYIYIKLLPWESKWYYTNGLSQMTTVLVYLGLPSITPWGTIFNSLKSSWTPDEFLYISIRSSRTWSFWIWLWIQYELDTRRYNMIPLPSSVAKHVQKLHKVTGRMRSQQTSMNCAPVDAH